MSFLSRATDGRQSSETCAYLEVVSSRRRTVCSSMEFPEFYFFSLEPLMERVACTLAGRRLDLQRS